MQRYFKVGMPVWCAIYGEGVVEEIDDNSPYNTVVSFTSGEYKSYTFDGRLYSEVNITLSSKPIPTITNEPIIEFNLTFAEAMEAVADKCKLQFEKWYNGNYIFLDYTFVKLRRSDGTCENYVVEIDEINGKWRVI